MNSPKVGWLATAATMLIATPSCDQKPGDPSPPTSEDAESSDGVSALAPDNSPGPICDTPAGKAMAARVATKDTRVLFTTKLLKRFRHYLRESFGIEELPEGAGTFFALRHTIEHPHESEHQFPDVYFAVPPEEIDGLFAYVFDRAAAACRNGRWQSLGNDQVIPQTVTAGDIEWNAGTRFFSVHGSRAPSGEHRDDRATWSFDPTTGWVKYDYIDWDDDE